MVVELDKEFKEVIYSPVCTCCKNLKDIKNHTCEAFPNGIPKAIWNGENNHTKPYPGDHGIRFESIKASKAS